jgi:hypothetical protein
MLLLPSPLLSTNSRLISQVYSIRRRRNLYSSAISFIGVVLNKTAAIYQQLFNFFNVYRCGQPLGQLTHLFRIAGLSPRQRCNRLFSSSDNSFRRYCTQQDCRHLSAIVFFSTCRCGQPLGQLTHLSGAEGGGAGANRGQGVPEEE